jgi:hypothetical protein
MSEPEADGMAESPAFARKPRPLGRGGRAPSSDATNIGAEASAGFASSRKGSLPIGRDGEASLSARAAENFRVERAETVIGAPRSKGLLP